MFTYPAERGELDLDSSDPLVVEAHRALGLDREDGVQADRRSRSAWR
jgi:hypothetical protein